MEIINRPCTDWLLTMQCPCGTKVKLAASDIEYYTWTETVCVFESIWDPPLFPNEYRTDRHYKYRYKCPVCKKKVPVNERDLTEEVKSLVKRL